MCEVKLVDAYLASVLLLCAVFVGVCVEAGRINYSSRF